MTDENRDPKGKFSAGNSAAKGRRRAWTSRIVSNRRALLAAIGPRDVRAIAAALLAEALKGSGQNRIAAAREILTLVCGAAAPEAEADHG